MDAPRTWRVRPIANLCCALLAVLLLVSYVRDLNSTYSDVQIYLTGAASIASEGHPYGQGSGFIYPPLLAYLLLPFVWIPFATLQLLWFVLSVALLLALVAIACGALLEAELRSWWGVVALLVALAPPTRACLNLGQLGIPIAALVAAPLALRRYPWGQGTALALGALLKLYPAIFGLLLLRQRMWRAIAGAAMTTLVIVSASLAAYGPRPYTQFIASALDASRRPPVAAEFNVSIYGFWSRLLTVNSFTAPLADLPALALGLTLLSCGALVVGGLLVARTDQPPAAWARTYSLWSALMLLLSPLNGYYNLMLLLLPTLALVQYGHSQRRPGYLLVAAAGVALVWVRPGWSGGAAWLLELTHRGWGVLLLALPLYGALIIALALWRICYNDRTPE